MEPVTEEIVKKALSMRRDYTTQEIAELLHVRLEDLFAAIDEYHQTGKVVPNAIPEDSGPPHPKPRGKLRKKKG